MFFSALEVFFLRLLTQVRGHEREWRTWIDRERPEAEELPCGYGRLLDPFRKLLLVRSWCPDRMLRAARSYVSETLGPLPGRLFFFFLFCYLLSRPSPC